MVQRQIDIIIKLHSLCCLVLSQILSSVSAYFLFLDF